MEMLMLINGVDVDIYLQTFDDHVLNGVHQWLEAFGCCDELREKLGLVLSEKLSRRRGAEARVKREKEKAVRRYVEDKGDLPPIQTIIGLCPKCNGPIRGEPLSSCETKKTGRVFYAECCTCKYYYEMFKHKRKTKYIKIEGGT